MPNCPRKGIILGYQLVNEIIGAIISALIPQTKDDENTLRCSLPSKGHHFTDILFGVLPAIAFLRMEGNLYLVGTGIDDLLPFRQECAIGSQHGYKSFLTGHLDKVRQQRMKERLTHQMKIQKLYLVLKPAGESIKFIQGQTMLGSVRLQTELAIEVADVGYFKIAAGYHNVVS